jgi:hypothetical protein
MTRPLLAAAALLASLSLAACAAAPPPAMSPEPPPPGIFGAPREANPADAEMLALGHAEEEIDRLFSHRDAPDARKSGAKSGHDEGARPRTPGRGPGDAGEPEKPDHDKDGEPDRPAPMAAGPGDPCAVACRALASMASAADRLCRLSGENDGRCDDARSRVRGATARVRSACPACASAVQAAPRANPPQPSSLPLP